MTRLSLLLCAARSPVESSRVGVWAWSESRRLKGLLEREGMGGIAALHPSPAVPAVHRATVSAVLQITGATCLVRSAVLQRWDADHERPRELVVGVARDADGFAAHAWLDGDPDADRYVELHRHPPA